MSEQWQNVVISSAIPGTGIIGFSSSEETLSQSYTNPIDTSSIPNPNTLLAPSFRLTAANTKVKSIVPYLSNIIVVKSTDSVAHAFNTLVNNSILSAPVFDVVINNYVYFIHLLDILAYLVNIYQYQTSSVVAPRLEELIIQDRFKTTPVTSVISRSFRNPWHSISKESSLQEAIELLFKTRADQVAVANVECIFSSILTQYTVVEWLASKSLEIGELASKTVDTLKLGYRDVISVNHRHTVLEAFLKMDALGVSGVAICDDVDRLIGNISATDLRDIGPGAENFRKLYFDCGTFIEQKQRTTNIPKLVAVNRDSTIKEVLDRFGKYHIHRVYVVEENTNLPVGIISDGDIIALFATAIPVVANAAQSRV